MGSTTSIVANGNLRNPMSPSAEELALPSTTQPEQLTVEWRLVLQAMSLFRHVDKELKEARAQWNQDWFHRIMRCRSRAVSRLRRRWNRITPTPVTPLGALRRRYDSNLAKYLR